MKPIKRRKALLISLGVYVTFFAVSVNPPERSVQATEIQDGANLYLYFLGGLTHIGLGLDVLDGQNRPVGIRVWDFGSRNHYSYKDEEWITGQRNWLGSLNNLSLLAGTTEGEMRAWDPTIRFGMSLESFKHSSKVKLRLPITRQQWQAINDWLYAQTTTFSKHHTYPENGLDIWFKGGVAYNLFTFNCATFLAQALFAGGIYTEDNLPKTLGYIDPVPSRWLLPLSMIAHYSTYPLLSEEMIRRKASALQQRDRCLTESLGVPLAVDALQGGSCTLS